MAKEKMNAYGLKGLTRDNVQECKTNMENMGFSKKCLDHILSP